jgi:predicted PurR-regulated permease PerM
MPVRDTPRWLIVWGVAVTAAAVIVMFLAWLARDALILIYVSALLAMGIAPLVRLVARAGARLFRRPLPRWIAPLLIYVAVLGSIAATAALIVPAFVRQARGFAEQVPEWYAAGQDWLIEHGVLNEAMSFREALEQAPGTSGDLVNNIAGTVWGVLGGAVGLVTLLILTFYLVVDSRKLRDGFVRLFPRERRARAGDMADEIVDKTSAWLGGQLLLSAIIGTSAAIALGVMGVPYFFVLALIAAIGEAVPVVGPMIAAIPAILVALTVSPKLALAVAVFYLIQQQIENNVLVPKIMERQVGLSPVAVIVALLLGTAWYGAVGAILSVPTAAIIKVVYQALWRDELATRQESPDRRDRRAA